MSTVPAKSTVNFIFVCIILSWKMLSMFIFYLIINIYLWTENCSDRIVFCSACWSAFLGRLVSKLQILHVLTLDGALILYKDVIPNLHLHVSIMITFQLWHIDTCKQHHGMKLIVPNWLLENLLHLLPLSSSSKWISNVCPICIFMFLKMMWNFN